jgi:2Fe-2S ferredoxin
MPLGVDLDVEAGESLMEAAQRLGYYWPTRCHGRALCTACQVKIASGAENFSAIAEEERDALGLGLAHDGSEGDRLRLACQARPLGDAVVIKDGVRVKGEAKRRVPWSAL